MIGILLGLGAGVSGVGVVAVGGLVGSVLSVSALYQTYAIQARRELAGQLGTTLADVSWTFFRGLLIVLLVQSIVLALGIYFGVPIVRRYGPYVAALFLAPVRATFGGLEATYLAVTSTKRKRE